MRPQCAVLLFVSAAAACGAVRAQIVLPSDVGVTMMASPGTNLIPGEPIDFTLTVTNHGSADVPTLILTSSTYVNELNVVSVNASECYLTLLVIDLSDGTAEYELDWDVAGLGYYPPFLPGMSLTCHFQMALTSQAPPTYNFSFGLPPTFETDSNPANDRATVVLQRAPAAPPAPVPALSLAMQCLLGCLSAGLGMWASTRRLRS